MDFAAEWRDASLAKLIRHILSTHHEYLKQRLPLLDTQLEQVIQDGHGDKEVLLEIARLFEGLYEEIMMHMRKEEMILFPAIEAYEAAVTAGRPLPPTPFGSVANPIRMMEMEHVSAGSALDGIRELTSDYTPPAIASETQRALLEGLRAVDEDLRTHIRLENEILFPRAIALERAADSRMRASFGC